MYRLALPRPTIRRTGGWLAPLLAAPAATAIMLANSHHVYTHLQAALALAIVAIPCLAYAHWRQTRGTQIPLFAVLAAAHVVFYCLSVFWTNLLDKAPESTATAVLAMALLGMCSLFFGMYLGVSGSVIRSAQLPDVPRDARDWWWIRAIACGQLFVPFLPVGTGGDFRQVIVIVLNFVPLVAFLILWDATLRGKGTSADRVVAVLFLAASVLAGLATGWLGGCVGTLLVASIAYFRVRRRIPAAPVAAIVAVMLFLQGGKPAYRERFWYGGDDAGAFEKAEYWIAKSAERLTAVSRDSGSVEAPLLERSSLAQESATVYENTPALVPYQYGATYEYLLVTLIPRFLWPNKPSMNDANRFYQSAYGVTQPEDLDHVAIGAGLIPEAYMNFGWFGIPAVMWLAGVILGVFERVFLGERVGAFASAVGLAYVLQLFSLNGQAAAYFGGMAQIIGLTLVIFLPALRYRPGPQLRARVRFSREVTA